MLFSGQSYYIHPTSSVAGPKTPMNGPIGGLKTIAKVKNDPQTPASISIPVGLPQSGGSCGLPTTLGGPTHHQSSHSHGGLATPNTTVGIGTPVAAQSSVRLGCLYFSARFFCDLPTQKN